MLGDRDKINARALGFLMLFFSFKSYACLI
jgi:hypothetical protein